MKVLSSPGGILVLVLMLCGAGVYSENGTEKCKLLSESASERAVLNRLGPLVNQNFSVIIDKDPESYTYIFQLCGDAGGVAGVGVIQIDNKKLTKTVIGRYNSTKVIGGSDWVMLIYENGDNYGSHCSKQKRKAIIMISCDRKINAV